MAIKNMAIITLKRCVIQPLLSYEPRLNDWSHQTHTITQEICEQALKTFQPILETIKKEDKEVREKQRWHYTTTEMTEKMESVKQMIKIFKSLKSIANEDTITLNFID